MSVWFGGASGLRNPGRMDKVLRELRRVWEMVPDWRLGQLVFNVAGRDPFYVEDYDLVELAFRKFGGGMVPDDGDFPVYWVEPDGMKEFVEGLHKKRGADDGVED